MSTYNLEEKIRQPIAICTKKNEILGISQIKLIFSSFKMRVRGGWKGEISGNRSDHKELMLRI